MRLLWDVDADGDRDTDARLFVGWGPGRARGVARVGGVASRGRKEKCLCPTVDTGWSVQGGPKNVTFRVAQKVPASVDSRVPTTKFSYTLKTWHNWIACYELIMLW